MSLAKIKKGDTVIYRMFSGIAVSVNEVIAADEKTITIQKKDGTKVKLSRKTGKQISPKAKSERFANFITEDDGSFKPSGRAAQKGKNKTTLPPKTKGKAKPEPDDDEIEDEEEPEEKPAKKATKKTEKKPEKKPSKPAKKPAKAEEEEEDFDEEEYEEE